MHDHAHHDHAHVHDAPAGHDGERRVFWVLLLTAGFMAIEAVGGWLAGSLALLADAIDFAGDALNYGVSLAVLAAALAWRARAAIVKAVSMIGFGAFVLARAVWSAWHGEVPEPITMGAVAALALAANVGVAAMLYTFREGDANMRSVWICTRNDALGNLAVGAAALGVFGTGTAWPDLVVAALMAALALSGGVSVWRQARAELRSGADAASQAASQARPPAGSHAPSHAALHVAPRAAPHGPHAPAHGRPRH